MLDANSLLISMYYGIVNSSKIIIDTFHVPRPILGIRAPVQSLILSSLCNAIFVLQTMSLDSERQFVYILIDLKDTMSKQC